MLLFGCESANGVGDRERGDHAPMPMYVGVPVMLAGNYWTGHFSGGR
jgi:hypothetical protein